LPGVKPGAGDPDRSPEMKVAIIGKRNSGKSSLVNALGGRGAGHRLGDRGGPTRDAVDVRFEFDGKAFIAIGHRRGFAAKKSFQDRIEWFAYDRASGLSSGPDVVALLNRRHRAGEQVDSNWRCWRRSRTSPSSSS